jgi:electron transport complex protein RnfD
MSQTEAGTRATAEGAAPPAPHLRVAPAPHLSTSALTTRRMMFDVLVALAPVVAVAIWVFEWYAVAQVGLAVIGCLAAEALFTWWRGRAVQLDDLSAAVTGVILGLSLPWSTPWYATVIAAFSAIGFGKIVFGGLGQNIFNPAMVGRAFAMIAFPAALGAAAYVAPDAAGVMSEATPLTAAKQAGASTPLWPLLVGATNGSLGETSAIAVLLGGIYLCLRRTASWEIPVSLLAAVAVLGGFWQLVDPDTPLTFLHHLAAGSVLFGAFFIATDPVSSPLTPRGKVIFGAGIGALIMVLRAFSGYPEGVMFAVLLFNALTPLLNRWTVPVPLGGPVPVRNKP